MAHERIVETLVRALEDEHLAAKQCSLRALANLSRLDLGISEALESGIMARLATILDPAAALPGAQGSALVCSGLQTLWNLANTPDGKVAALDAALLPLLAHHCTFCSPREQRLAAGAIMAVRRLQLEPSTSKSAHPATHTCGPHRGTDHHQQARQDGVVRMPRAVRSPPDAPPVSRPTPFAGGAAAHSGLVS